MPGLKFKNASKDDLEAIVDIYNSTIASRMVTADTQPVTVSEKENWFLDHHPGKRPLWIIENDRDEIIGWVSFQSFYGRPAYDATAEISIYLKSDERGKGIGKEVLQYCISKAPSLGIRTLLGFIFSHNEQSLKLFRHFGFEDWATLPNIAVLDDKEYSLSILGKRIA